jgi:8-oxo-dGTP pyrophosphatase MutT (NUDIX family)
MTLSPEREQEIASLCERYGSPHRVTVPLHCPPFDPLTKTDRIGEVCMVVRRMDGRLITARKVFYPSSGYRLLTGGIAHDERIEDALLRETWEETSLEVTIRRFLAVIDYRLEQPSGGESLVFYTFAFLLDEQGGTLAVQDEQEQIADFRMIFPHELPVVAETLEHVTDSYDEKIEGKWRDWGVFRAVVHRVVFDVMEGMTSQSCFQKFPA